MSPESDVTPELLKGLEPLFDSQTVTAAEAIRRLKKLDPMEKMRLFEQRKDKFKLIKK